MVQISQLNVSLDTMVTMLLDHKFDSEPFYVDNDKYIKTKIRFYGDKANTNFEGEKITKEKTAYKCLLLIMLDSVVTVNKKYYLQTLLEDCKYEMKMTTMGNFINDDIEPSSSDNETESDSDNESASEPKKPSKESDNE